MSFLDRFFTPPYEHTLKKAGVFTSDINELEGAYQQLSIDEIRALVRELKGEYAQSGSLDSVLVRMFALTREAAKRTLGLRHYDVQLVGGVLLHQGKITEMRTGEGKTLVGTLPAALNALTGEGVHVVTVNDYLARRDAVWMGQIYAYLGLSVSVINHDSSYLYDASHTGEDPDRDLEGAYKVFYEYLRPCTRHEAYQADITYGTNSEFGFDYLRDNIEFDARSVRQRGHVYAIVDEIDSILIDEARTPLIISGPAQDSENLYVIFAKIAAQLRAGEHFEVDEKLRSVALTDVGIEEAEKLLGVENIYTDKGIKYVHHLETAVKAKGLYSRDKEYVVRDGEVVIVDEFTGRLQPGRRWSDGLHQAIEAKENVSIQRESKTYASITYQNFFRMYKKLAGMTGTALTSEEEFYSVYKLEVVPVPTHKAVARIDRTDLIFQTTKGKYEAIIRKVREVHKKGQPVLIGTASIDTNESLSQALTLAGIPHEMLNAKNHEREGEIIAQAGERGKVTLATNMAGRGVDIKLGGIHATAQERDEVIALGGLFVLGTERHEARRIDNQLRGRSGRQGDPGETQFYVSMEDQLMRVFGGDRIKSLMGTFGIPEDQPLETKLISRQLEGAQSRIEGFHFDARKQVLAYDNVLNQQRQIVYERRSKLLLGARSEVAAVLEEVMVVRPELREVIKEKEIAFTTDVWFDLARRLCLQVIDSLWVEHLEVMQSTRSSVNLRAYGQRDPLIEYRKEGLRLFKEMQDEALHRIGQVLPQVEPEALVKEEEALKQERKRALAEDAQGGSKTERAPKVSQSVIGRNELVTITNGSQTQTIKFKKAQGMIATGEWRML